MFSQHIVKSSISSLTANGDHYKAGHVSKLMLKNGSEPTDHDLTSVLGTENFAIFNLLYRIFGQFNLALALLLIWVVSLAGSGAAVYVIEVHSLGLDTKLNAFKGTDQVTLVLLCFCLHKSMVPDFDGATEGVVSLKLSP